MNSYVLLAKQAIENYIKEKTPLVLPSGLSPDLLIKKAGVFVTVMKGGELRGCIGTYLPIRENIAEEIIYNAVAAATEDNRFESISEEELPQLSYAVYLLNEPELIKDLKELDPKKYGIVIKTSYKSGLLLPDLEGIDTIEKQIAIACEKGGVDPAREKFVIYRFSAEKYQ